MTRRAVPMLHVPDVAATARWYESIGFSVDRTHEACGETLWAHLSFGESALMLSAGGRPSDAHRREVDLCIHVDDVEAAFAAVAPLAELVEPLHDTEYGMREFIVRDCNRFWMTFGQPIPVIRRATPADAAALAELAARTFRETFGADNRPEDLAMHLATAYGPEQQGRELEDAAIATLVAEQEGALVAFAQLRRGHTPDCVTGPSPIELWRFYVAAAWHGRGLAQRLMARVFDAARDGGAATLWLGVWERNPRAIAYYRKEGFTDVGSHTFVVGTDAQVDRILTRPVGGEAQGR